MTDQERIARLEDAVRILIQMVARDEHYGYDAVCKIADDLFKERKDQS